MLLHIALLILKTVLNGMGSLIVYVCMYIYIYIILVTILQPIRLIDHKCLS